MNRDHRAVRREGFRALQIRNGTVAETTVRGTQGTSVQLHGSLVVLCGELEHQEKQRHKEEGVAAGKMNLH